MLATRWVVALLVCLAFSAHSSPMMMMGFRPPAAPSGQTFYFVGGTGNTNDSANWDLSSGGAGGDGVPATDDTAIIDASSCAAACTITLDANMAVTTFTIENDATDQITFAFGINTLTVSGDATFGDADGLFTASTGSALSVGGDLDTSANTFDLQNLDVTLTGTGFFDYVVNAGESTNLRTLTAAASGQTTTLRLVGDTQVGTDLDIYRQVTLGGGTLNASRARVTDNDWPTTVEIQDAFTSITPFTGTGTIAVSIVELSPEFGSDMTIDTDIVWNLATYSDGTGGAPTNGPPDHFRIRGNGGQVCESASSPDITLDGNWTLNSLFKASHGVDMNFDANSWTVEEIQMTDESGCKTLTFTTGVLTTTGDVSFGGSSAGVNSVIDLGSASHTIGGCLIGRGADAAGNNYITASTGQVTINGAASGCLDNIYVDFAATGLNDGTSCTDAYQDWSQVEGHLLTSADCVYICASMSLGTGDDLDGATAGKILSDPAGSQYTLTMNGQFDWDASGSAGVQMCDIILDW